MKLSFPEKPEGERSWIGNEGAAKQRKDILKKIYKAIQSVKPQMPPSQE